MVRFFGIRRTVLRFRGAAVRGTTSMLLSFPIIRDF